MEVEEISGAVSRIVMDGEAVSAPVTESVLRQMAPGRGFEVRIDNDLPCGEGFGMSAAGAIAVALCLSELTDSTRQCAFEAAHTAEIEGGGGLGDVSALYCLAHQPVRVREGLPPSGMVIGTGVEFPSLTLAVLGPKMHTGSVLSNPVRRAAIAASGASAVDEYLRSPSVDSLYALSNAFSKEAGVECPAVTEALVRIRRAGGRAAMCMLGNSIFTDLPPEEAQDLLEDARIFVCASTDRPAEIIRKG